MGRYLFYDDYSDSPHSEILAALEHDNRGQQLGYGEDDLSKLACSHINAEFGRDVDVHFVSGGTQANIVCLASILQPHQGVIAASSGHIAVHETGAIEATGHKVIAVESHDGKLTPALIDKALTTHHDEHTVMPKVVFVSQATELGTVYTPDELAMIARHAAEHGLITYVDGARLAMALAATGPGATLADISDIGIDLMYIGGTKNGGLFGEAIVILNPALGADFRYHLKQRGALLAKSRALGAQFVRFFDADGLWYRLGREANQQATRLANGLRARGVELDQPQETNQVFPVLPEKSVDSLSDMFGFHRWTTRDDGNVVIRLVCSWATPDSAIDELVAAVQL